jgi:hypothetical protein
METSVQCYMVQMWIIPDLLGKSILPTYFLAKSDRDAIKDSFRHAQTLVETYNLRVTKLEVFDCHLSTIADGVNQGGIDRMLYNSSSLDDSIIQERPAFIR